MCQMWGIFASFLKTYSVSLDFKFWEPSLGLFGECAEHIVISNHKKKLDSMAQTPRRVLCVCLLRHLADSFGCSRAAVP